MIKEILGKSYFYLHQPKYSAAFWGLTARVDIWKADSKGNRSQWVGSVFKTERGFHQVGDVKPAVRSFCEGVLRGGN